MSITFDRAQTSIAQLVQHFKTNLALYRAPTYLKKRRRGKRSSTRCLCTWAGMSTTKNAPRHNTVKWRLSRRRRSKAKRKRPITSFASGPKRKFFVEAKQPGVSIKSDARPAYQVRRHAWSAKLPLSLLTDFEELAVYDCRTRLLAKDQASVARINFYTFDEYPDRWKEIWDVFSREAVRGGSFDQVLEHAKGKRR